MLGVSGSEVRVDRAADAPTLVEPPRDRPIERGAPTDVRGALLGGGAVALAALGARLGGTVGVFLAALGCFFALALAARELVSLRALAPWWLWVNPAVGALALLGRALVRPRPASSLALSAAVAWVLPLIGWIARSAMADAQRALDAQGEALPRTARVRRADREDGRTLEARALRAGEEILVEAGERVAVDGVVRGGEATIEEPGRERVVGPGHAVLAGSLVRRGALEVLATRAGDDVALARVRAVLEDGSLDARALRWARAGLAGLALGLGAWWALGFSTDPLVTLGLALGALPPGTGFALGRVPLAHALAEAIARGAVFRDRAGLERAGRVRAVVLCARGTLTRGTLELVEVVSLGTLTERALLALAAGAESAAPEHPNARAFVDAARARGVRPEPVRRPVALAGRGVLAVNGSGAPIVLGTRALLIAENVAVAPGEEVARSIEAQGRHALFLSIDGRVEAVFGLEDPPRDEARAAVQSLMDRGIDVALVGGESAGTLEALGLSVDVTHVRGEVAPEDRAAAVRAISEVAGRVAVAGRPALDDLALGAADVSIGLEAAGGTGAECTIALTGDDLREAAGALLAARRARLRVIRVQIACAAVSALGLLSAASLRAPRIAAPVVVAFSALGGLLAWGAARRR